MDKELATDSPTSADIGPSEWHTGAVKAGVGPWVVERGTPLPADPKYDKELLLQGDTRNVIDKYRYWTIDAIVADLDTKRHSLEVAVENLQHDANIGTIVRTANAFLVNKVHIVGKKRWNRRGAMVTDKYQPLVHQATIQDLLTYKEQQGLQLVVVDNTPQARPLEQTKLPKNSLLLFGHEGLGVSNIAIQNADLVVKIAQFGSTRSINVGVAAGILMHNWISQYGNWQNTI